MYQVNPLFCLFLLGQPCTIHLIFAMYFVNMSYLSRRTFIQCQVILDCYFSICQIRLEYVVGEVQKYKLLLVSYCLKDSLSFVVSFAKYTSIPKLHKSILLSNFYDSPPFAF